MKSTPTRRPFRRVLFILLPVLVVAGIVLALTRKPEAPDVTFNPLAGQKMTLRQLRGKVVYIDFWATSCVGCVHDAPELARLYQQYHGHGLEMIGVNAYYDPANYVQKFVQDFHVPYPDVLDPQGTIAHAFGDIQVVPTSFLIGRNGKIVQQFVGDPDFTRLRAAIDSELARY
jgi:peroxiredoxin